MTEPKIDAVEFYAFSLLAAPDPATRSGLLRALNNEPLPVLTAGGTLARVVELAAKLIDRAENPRIRELYAKNAVNYTPGPEDNSDMTSDRVSARTSAYALLSAVGDPDTVTDTAVLIPDYPSALKVIAMITDCLADLFDRIEAAGIPVRAQFAENATFSDIAANEEPSQ